MRKQEIIMICGKQIEKMAYELCERADLENMIRSSCVKESPKIALKPNLLGPIPAEEGATTHPQIVRGVTGYLRDHGFENIIVMESSWVGDRTEDSLLVTGFGDLCRELGLAFIDLQKENGVETDCAGMKIRVCESALTADYLINLPVLKGHCQTRMTCALKNMKGCIPASEKRRFHRMGLHEPIGHLSAGVHQDFILADAVCPDLTFEDGGNPVQLDRLLCAADPVLLDRFGAEMIGLKKEDVPYIEIAARCGIGSDDLRGAQVTTLLENESTGTYTEGIAPPCPGTGDYRSILKIKEMVCDVDSCSACYGSLLPVLKKLEEEGLLKNIKKPLCIGQGFRKKTGETGIGNCTLNFRKYLPGCPPSSEEIERFLRAEYGSGK